MKAAIYTPYLDTLGGGERYVLSAAQALLEEGWNVDIEAIDLKIIRKAEKRFNLDLGKIKAVNTIKRGDGYDLCFWLSDGSIPRLLSRINILHFQRPFYDVDGKSLFNRMKFFRINHVVVNSQFTKQWIDKEYPKEAMVLYPPVGIDDFKSSKKQNLILYLGRFSQLEQSKRQDILLEAFKKFHDNFNDKFKLVLAGGSEVGRTDFVDKLKESSKGYPVEILESPDFKNIQSLFAKAKFFWSASGYGVKVEKEPQKVEHFGITVVEAMASAAVPIIYNAGGHKEIVKEGENGSLWKNKEELIIKTDKLINNSDNYNKMSKEAVKDSNKYSYENFKKEFLKLTS